MMVAMHNIASLFSCNFLFIFLHTFIFIPLNIIKLNQIAKEGSDWVLVAMRNIACLRLLSIAINIDNRI